MLPQISGNDIGCAPNTYTVPNAGQFPPGTLFTWTYNASGAAPLTATGTTFSLTPSQTASGRQLTLTATPPYGCPTETKLQINGCCVPHPYSGNGPAIYVAKGAPGSNKASDMLALFGGNVPLNAQIDINGRFTVDVNLDRNLVDARFGEDAKVVLNNGRQFNIIRSHLYACDKMWQGLEVDHPTESIYRDESKIEHAYTAVKSLSGGDIFSYRKHI